MPRNVSDFNSILELAIEMKNQLQPSKRYTGIIPASEKDLAQARKELAMYYRIVWDDEEFAKKLELR